jgi:dihydrofolate reductase
VLTITLAVVVSKDGFITQGDNPNPSSWSSKEDKKNYQQLLKQFPVYIMGEKTYLASKSMLPHNATKIVLTTSSQPAKSPTVICETGPVEELVSRLSQTYKTALLLGGAYTYRQFLDKNLVDTAMVTLEPIELKSGISLFGKSGNPIDYFRELMGMETTVKKMNDSGTLLYEFMRK